MMRMACEIRATMSRQTVEELLECTISQKVQWVIRGAESLLILLVREVY